MEIRLPLQQGLSLKIDDQPPASKRYATAGLQRGWRLMRGDEDLAEEAVGFGVPVLKRGLETIFPGSASLEVGSSVEAREIRAHFHMNLVERFSRGADVVDGGLFYAAKDLLAASIRRLPPVRAPLTAVSSWLRAHFHWQTTYAPARFFAELTVAYQLDPVTGKLTVELDMDGLPSDVTEVVLMHEQGAHHFSQYEDSSGIRVQDDEIGCWDEVQAKEAWFKSPEHGIAFKLARLQGAKLYRGRELVGSRLAWAGFGYSLRPDPGVFRHELELFRPE